MEGSRAQHKTPLLAVPTPAGSTPGALGQGDRRDRRTLRGRDSSSLFATDMHGALHVWDTNNVPFGQG